MIKELVQFVEHLDPMLKNKGVEPKEGLHIVVKLMDTEGVSFEEPLLFRSGKIKMVAPFPNLAAKTQLAWNVNTNKCFDLPAKGVHSCSPFVVAFKKESLEGGEKYKKDKIKIYDRFEQFYFPKALKLLEDDKDTLEKATHFARFMYNRQRWESSLKELKEFKELKDKEYIVFYLDVDDALYEAANKKYLNENLFNTNFYNEKTKNSNGEDILNGTSDFFNGYNSKKPFLMHQTASFDITGRITEEEARGLFEFQKIIRRGFLPRPLPIFIYKEEIKQAVRLFEDEHTKQTYRDIIKGFIKDNKEAHNYYLLFYQADEIRDFDFVSKFEYELRDTEGEKWRIDNLFSKNSVGTIDNVFDFETKVLPIIFNNNLAVVAKDKPLWIRYFDDIEAKNCRSEKTYLMMMKYRKAFYDFIYKSYKHVFTTQHFDDLMKTLVFDNILRDDIKMLGKIEVHTEGSNIRQKLNVWFSLREKFDLNFNNKIEKTMASKLKEMQIFMNDLLNEKAEVTSEEQYAFIAGQVIYYILSKSRSKDKSYKRLEPFLQQTQYDQFRQVLTRTFNRYTHENFSSKFRTAFANVEINAHTKFENENLANMMPIMLAGFFSNNQLFSDKEKIQQKETDVELDNEESED